jgi:hypothetical protein
MGHLICARPTFKAFDVHLKGNALKVIIKNSTFTGVGSGTGILSTGSAHIEIDNTSFSGHVDGLRLTEPASLIQQIGLPADTPVEHIMEVLRIIGRGNPAEREESLHRSRLAEFLGGTADILAIAGAIGSATGLG